MKNQAIQYLALDVHQATVVATARDEQGTIRMRATVPTEANAILSLVRGVGPRVRVAFEEGTQAQWLYLGLNRNHNPTLKNVFKGAANAAAATPGPLKDFYDACVARGVRESVHGCEQGGGAVSFVVVSHGAAAALLDRKARLEKANELLMTVTGHAAR